MLPMTGGGLPPLEQDWCTYIIYIYILCIYIPYVVAMFQGVRRPGGWAFSETRVSFEEMSTPTVQALKDFVDASVGRPSPFLSLGLRV